VVITADRSIDEPEVRWGIKSTAHSADAAPLSDYALAIARERTFVLVTYANGVDSREDDSTLCSG